MENNTVEKENIKEPKTTKQKVFLGLRIAFNVVFYALIIFLFLFSIMNIRGGNGTENFPNIFGRGFLSVQSDSMERDEKKTIYTEWKDYEVGGFTTGDLLNVKTFSESDADKLKVGDVITYQWTINGKMALNTHRIVNIYKDSEGKYVFVTQGDKIAQTTKYNPNWTPIEMKLNNQAGVFEDSITTSMIKGVVTSVNSGAGKFLDTIQKNWLFIFVIPIIVLLVIEVFLVVRNIMILRGEKNKLELENNKDAILADEKEKLRQELLAELRAQGLAPAEEPKEEPKAEEPVVEPTPVVLEKAKEEPQEESTPEVEETPVEEAPAQEEADPVTEEVEAEAQPEEPQTEEVEEETSEPQQEETENEEVVEESAPEATEENIEEKVEETKEEPVEEKPKKAPAKKSTTTKKASTSTKSTTAKKTTSTTKKKTTTKKAE